LTTIVDYVKGNTQNHCFGQRSER